MQFNQNLPFSDLTVVCSGRSFNVHKIMLHQYSDWFHAALTSGFQEGAAATIILQEDDPKLVEAMLKHCYHQTYDEVTVIDQDDKGVDIFDAKMFCFADKYQCRPLARDIAAYFEDTFKQDDDTDDLDLTLFPSLDIIYDLPAGSLLTVFQNMFQRAFVGKLPMYLKSPKFQELYQRRALLAFDCLDMIKQHYNLRAR